MSYEYTDDFHQPLKVETYEWADESKTVMITAANTRASVELDDAPAVALAILEAAGWNDDGPDHDEYDPANVILTNLRDLVQDLAEEKKCAQRREAEDAEVREFVEAIPGVSYLDESEEHWRHLYRAAREFFTKGEAGEKAHNHPFGDEPVGTCPNCDGKPEPRVLRHGAPEPDFGTRWRDTGGHVWSFGNTSHRNYPVWRMDAGSSWGRWSHLDSCFFPMTEVTE